MVYTIKDSVCLVLQNSSTTGAARPCAYLRNTGSRVQKSLSAATLQPVTLSCLEGRSPGRIFSNLQTQSRCLKTSWLTGTINPHRSESCSDGSLLAGHEHRQLRHQRQCRQST